MAENTIKIINLDSKKDKQEIVQLAHFWPKGGSGTDISGGVYSEEYLSKLTSVEAAETYDEMRRSDDQVKMLLRVVKNPIVSASWSIEPVDDSDEEKHIRDFIQYVLFDNMGNPKTDKIKTWSEFIKEVMTNLEFGFSLFEVTHKVVLNDVEFGDYIGIKDIGWRSPKTIYQWNLNSDGSIENVQQIVSGDLDRMVNIDGKFLLVFSPHKEGDNYEGISDLRPIYGNWFRKNFLRKLQMIGIERAATGVPIATIPSGKINTPEQTVLENILQAFINHEKNFLLKPEGFDVTELKITHDAEKVLLAIDQENVGMTKSFLANFLELGVSAKGGGAYALSNDLSDIFLGGIEFYSDLIEEIVNIKIIRKLVNAKFGKRRKYPKLKASGIKDKAGQEFAEIMKGLSDSDLIQKSDKLKAFVHKTFKFPDFIEDLEQVNIDDETKTDFSELNLSEIQTIIFSKENFDKQSAFKWLKENGFKSSKIDETKDSFRFRQFESGLFSRFRSKVLKPGITAVIGFGEKETQLAEPKNKNISKQIDLKGKELFTIMSASLQPNIETYINSIITKTKNNPPSKQRTEVSKIIIPGKRDYKKILDTFIADLLKISTDDVKKELDLSQDFKFTDIGDLKGDVPAQAIDTGKAQVELLAETQYNDIKKQVLFSYNKNLNTVSIEHLESQLVSIAETYLTGSSLLLAGGNTVSTIINEVRNAVFQTKEVFEEIESFIFTNPDPIAAVCVNLAGRVFSKQEYLTTDRLPPLHHNCDSFIRAQRTTEKVIKPVDTLGLNYTGSPSEVEKIIKSKKF